MFHILAEDLEGLEKRWNERYMLQALKHVTQLKHGQPPEFRILKLKERGSV